jgi:hypothetical protein
MLSVIYAGSFMLSVSNEPLLLVVIRLNVVILSVVVPFTGNEIKMFCMTRSFPAETEIQRRPPLAEVLS